MILVKHNTGLCDTVMPLPTLGVVSLVWTVLWIEPSWPEMAPVKTLDSPPQQEHS